MHWQLRHVSLVHPYYNPPRLGEQICRDYHLLVFVTSGSIAVEVDGQTITGEMNDYFYYYPGRKRYYREPVKSPETETVVMTWYGKTGDSMLLRSVLNSDRNGGMRYACMRLVEIYNRYGQQAIPLMDALFEVFRFEFHLSCTQTCASPLDKLKQDLPTMLSRKIDTNLLAKRVNYSPKHFHRLFVDKFGVSPMKYVQRLRIERAKNLLFTSGLPLKSIAKQVGICNEFHLSKLLKKHTGYSPRELQKCSFRKAPPGNAFTTYDLEQNDLLLHRDRAVGED